MTIRELMELFPYPLREGTPILKVYDFADKTVCFDNDMMRKIPYLDNEIISVKYMSFEKIEVECDISSPVKINVTVSGENEGEYGVYEVYTWDNVDYTLRLKCHTREKAEVECDKLKQARRAQGFENDPVTYCVKSDIEYYNLMRD